jgi:hypothetical protein
MVMELPKLIMQHPHRKREKPQDERRTETGA